MIFDWYDWLDKHHAILDFYNKDFTCLDEEGNLITIQGIPRPISIKEISSLQLKRSFRKGCQNICNSYAKDNQR
jgi:hypothetical protein